MVHKNRPDACIQAFGEPTAREFRPDARMQAFRTINAFLLALLRAIHVNFHIWVYRRKLI